MFPDTSRDASVSAPVPAGSSRLESVAFYVLLATIVLAPLLFVPSPYISLDLVKTAVIALGTLVSAFLYALCVWKKRSMELPPRSIVWTSGFVMLSLVLSALGSTHIGKSFFGQGFELGTAAFLITLFIAAAAAFAAVRRDADRAIVIYVGLTASFVILALFHALRFMAGADFATLGILGSTVATVLGNWYSLGVYATIILLVSIFALSFLPLSGRLKAVYWILAVVSFLASVVVNNVQVWFALGLMSLFLTIWMSVSRPRPEGPATSAFFRRIAWVPLIATVVAIGFAWKGTVIAAPLITKLGAGYSELRLPWQLTLDVTGEAIKTSPILGAGPNRFGQEFVAHKPALVNASDVWTAEFNYGFGLIPTFIATQGILGVIAWVLFFIFFGFVGIRALRRLPSDPRGRFIIVSSYFTAVFLWLTCLFYVPSHVIIFFTFIMTGIAFGSMVKYGATAPWVWSPIQGSRSYKMLPSATMLILILLIVGMFIYAKKTVSLAYFGAGVKQLTSVGNAEAADTDFSKALAFDDSDVYYQGRAEAGMARASKLASSVAGANNNSSSTQAVAGQIVEAVNQSLGYANSAIAYDPTNYYNYVSAARVSELASSLKITGSYENALKSYQQAIAISPANPSLYLNLARLQASQNKLEDSLRTIGAALQVKNNYLDAIFLLSQVSAAMGNLKDAITAATVATQINPRNPLLFFQLGLLQYNNKDYAAAAAALDTAVTLQADYANARYFLGLSDVRLGKITEAIAHFEELQKGNPDNQEVAFILSNLKAGKSPFADAQPPVTPTPEKRSTLPIKQQQ